MFKQIIKRNKLRPELKFHLLILEAHGYSSEGTQQELSNEHQQDRV